VSRDEAAIRRARRALESAADEAGQTEHPGIESLEAYVEGRLSAEDRARLDELAARLPMVAEDLADLRSVQAQLASPPLASRSLRWGRVAAAAAIAATLALGVWLTVRSTAPPDAAAPATIAALTQDERARVDGIVAAGRITVPAAVAALNRPAGTLLGTSSVPATLSPVMPLGTAVRSTRPSFTWTDAGADAYTVAIFDERFTEVARSPRIAGTSWTPAADLQRGGSYLWQVTAHRAAGDLTAPQPPNPEARFVVIDAATAARIDALEGRASSDPLAFGILLADAGLVIDARAQLERAARVPATADAARRLLDSLGITEEKR
jgi:hypothetical protein